jgi:hypothetical protein
MKQGARMKERSMLRLLAGGAGVLILLLSTDARACWNDRDCPGASRCVRTWGGKEGVCEHGIAPIQGDDPRRIGHPGRPKGTQGQACELNVDCMEGFVCAMQPNTDVRICTRR